MPKLETRAEIKLTTAGTRADCDAWAQEILGQDPMGELDQEIEITIGPWNVHGFASGFASGGRMDDYCQATITIRATDWEAK